MSSKVTLMVATGVPTGFKLTGFWGPIRAPHISFPEAQWAVFLSSDSQDTSRPHPIIPMPPTKPQ